MGPACEVLLPFAATDALLTRIDDLLADFGQQLERTRKGRVWDLRVDGRPIHVSINADVVTLSCGLKSAEDRAVLKRVSTAVAAACDGIVSDPE